MPCAPGSCPHATLKHSVTSSSARRRPLRRKGQLTNEVLFGGVSLGPQGSRSLDEIKKTSDKGIRIK